MLPLAPIPISYRCDLHRPSNCALIAGWLLASCSPRSLISCLSSKFLQPETAQYISTLRSDPNIDDTVNLLAGSKSP
jgi:hypothetical protein